LGLDQILQKKRAQYTEEISTYFEDEALYSNLASDKKLYNLEVLKYLDSYKVKTVYTAQSYLPPYCTECKKISTEQDCKHDLISLSKTSDIIRFKTRKWKDKFLRYFGTLYQIITLQPINKILV
jgi:hypothetical protein